MVAAPGTHPAADAVMQIELGAKLGARAGTLAFCRMSPSSYRAGSSQTPDALRLRAGDSHELPDCRPWHFFCHTVGPGTSSDRPLPARCRRHEVSTAPLVAPASSWQVPPAPPVTTCLAPHNPPVPRPPPAGKMPAPRSQRRPPRGASFQLAAAPPVTTCLAPHNPPVPRPPPAGEMPAPRSGDRRSSSRAAPRRGASILLAGTVRNCQSIGPGTQRAVVLQAAHVAPITTSRDLHAWGPMPMQAPDRRFHTTPRSRCSPRLRDDWSGSISQLPPRHRDHVLAEAPRLLDGADQQAGADVCVREGPTE